MTYDEDSANAYKKKIWNAVAFLIISELIFVIADLIKAYYGDYYFSTPMVVVLVVEEAVWEVDNLWKMKKQNYIFLVM